MVEGAYCCERDTDTGAKRFEACAAKGVGEHFGCCGGGVVV